MGGWASNGPGGPCTSEGLGGGCGRRCLLRYTVTLDGVHSLSRAANALCTVGAAFDVLVAFIRVGGRTHLPVVKQSWRIPCQELPLLSCELAQPFRIGQIFV